MNFVKTTGRIFNIARVACALVYPEQTMVFCEDYHPETLTGEDAARVNAALLAAGFIGDEILFHPERVSVAEDAGASLRVFLAGSERVISVPRALIEGLITFPAQETVSDKPARRKKGSAE